MHIFAMEEQKKTFGDQIATERSEEPTLTDRLNKKLLQSFLNRLDEGSFQVRLNSATESQESEETSSFDEQEGN